MLEVLMWAVLALTLMASIFGIVVIFLVYRALVAEKMLPKLTLAREPTKNDARKTPHDRAAENLARLNRGDG